MEQKSIENYLYKMLDLQGNLIEFLDLETDLPEDFKNLSKKFENSKICDDKHEFQSLLRLISKIGNNRHHSFDFFKKIDQILQYFRDSITKYFTNSEIFDIFKGNKRILLFFVENKIIQFDHKIVRKISRAKYRKMKYPQYFQPEIEPLMNEKWFPKYYYSLPTNMAELKKDLPEDFYELRKIGENESHICELIRTDSVDEFISYVNKENIPLDSSIYPSIYETNSFLANKQLKIIEYAAFFGSIQILNYLKMNQIKFSPSLWSFTIHSNNPEVFQLLEDEKIDHDLSYKQYYIESIKCHHNIFANYFLDNFLTNDKVLNNECFKDYNFAFIVNDEKTKLLLKGENLDTTDQSAFNEFFVNLCKYDYFVLVESILKNETITIDENSIYMKIFQCNSFCRFYRAALFAAIEKEHNELFKFLSANKNIDINIPYILIIFLFIEF